MTVNPFPEKHYNCLDTVKVDPKQTQISCYNRKKKFSNSVKNKQIFPSIGNFIKR